MTEFLIDDYGHIYPNNPTFAAMPQMRPYTMQAKVKPVEKVAPPSDPVVTPPADAGNKFQGRR
jgi:hypothetical protein